LIGDPRRLRWLAAGLALVPALWLLPELWGSGSLWRGAERAQAVGPDAPSNAARPAFEVTRNAAELTPAVVYLGIVAGIVALALRAVPQTAVRPVAGLAALGMAWLALVAVMTELGFSGIERYLLPPVAIAYVVAGVGLAWALGSLVATGTRSRARIAVAALLSLVAAVALVRAGSTDWPPVRDSAERHDDITWELDSAIARAGGERRLEECGAITASYLMVPPVAWTLDRHLTEVTPRPRLPGAILRARLLKRYPIDPPPDALEGKPGRTQLARTESWWIEGVCAR
jgi:hypothetical protein